MSNQATNCPTCHKNPCQCRPTYPHTEWLNNLRPAASTRFLSQGELLGFVEALLYEYMQETLIPEFTAEGDTEYMKANIAKAKIAAENLALGLSNDIRQVMERGALIIGLKQGLVKPS